MPKKCCDLLIFSMLFLGVIQLAQAEEIILLQTSLDCQSHEYSEETTKCHDTLHSVVKWKGKRLEIAQEGYMYFENDKCVDNRLWHQGVRLWQPSYTRLTKSAYHKMFLVEGPALQLDFPFDGRSFIDENSSEDIGSVLSVCLPRREKLKVVYAHYQIHYGRSGTGTVFMAQAPTENGDLLSLDKLVSLLRYRSEAKFK